MSDQSSEKSSAGRHSTLEPLTEEAAMDDEVAVAATTRVAQVFDLHALKAFAPDKRVRKMLFKTEQLWSEIACYEPGQSTVMHTHTGQQQSFSRRERPT